HDLSGDVPTLYSAVANGSASPFSYGNVAVRSVWPISLSLSDTSEGDGGGSGDRTGEGSRTPGESTSLDRRGRRCHFALRFSGPVPISHYISDLDIYLKSMYIGFDETRPSQE